MKTLQSFWIFLILASLTYSQSENYFFPPDTVFEYRYEAFPLDSNSNPVLSEMFYRSDLFFDIAEYEGKQANIFKTKEASTLDSLALVPYSDSLYFHFDGADGYKYFQVDPLLDFLESLDSMGLDPNFSFVDFFTSLEDWYSVYRFSAALNDEYTLFSVDTMVAGFIARVEFLGERLPDEIINTTHHGNINCKKFLNSLRVSVKIFTQWVPLITIEDYVWIKGGENFWMVQEIVPTLYVDFSFFNIDPFYIYGIEYINPLVVSVENQIENIIPKEYSLEQNYPNPFNPSTTITFTISSSGFSTLKIYNSIGEIVEVLLDKELSSGSYKIEWNASKYPSGVYFYQLITNEFFETKKMILLK